MLKRVASPQPSNAPTQVFSAYDASRYSFVSYAPNRPLASKARADLDFRLLIGVGIALAMLLALPFVPTVAAPQLPAPAKQPLPLLRSSDLAKTVRVRIWSLASPSVLRAIPVDSASRMRLCASCRWNHVSDAVEARAESGLVQIGYGIGERLSSGAAEFSGFWRFEAPGLQVASSESDATVAESDGHLNVTVVLSTEEYVAKVLAAEARGVTSSESLKAMAVAIRTYAARFRSRHRAEGYDFCDSTHCQALRLSGAAERYVSAAQATAGEILTYNGKPASTYYHRDCGGMREAAGIAWHDSDVPYLKQQTDPYCMRLKHEGWSVTIDQGDLRRALLAAGINPPPGWHGIEVVTRTPSGRARKLRLVGSSNLLIAAAALRLATARTLGGNRIRSDLFDIRSEGDSYIFSGVGSGHGVGMCQDGAAEMGIEGKDYDDILAFYYPGTTLRASPQITAMASGN